MAGICAYISPPRYVPSPNTLLAYTLESMFPLDCTKSLVVPALEEEIALGGVFPKHFQRKNNYISRYTKTILFYGELSDVSPFEEAESVFEIFETQGILGLADLNGPFALMCWDSLKKILTFASDRFGRIPLYYFSRGGVIGITTDLHACYAAGILFPSLCQESIIDLMTIGFSLGQKSMFDGVSRISGGEFCTVSERKIKRGNYWWPKYVDEPTDMKHMVHTFELCTKKAVDRWNHPAVALSGGWDSRATWASLKAHRHHGIAMTYGAHESTDVEIASTVAQSLNLRHDVIEPDAEFFLSFPDLAQKTIMLGNGHVLVDFAFQLYVFRKLLNANFDVLVDSAGCEFRRGIRARNAAKKADSVLDISRYLMSLHSMGIWNPDYIDPSFYSENQKSTLERLSTWLEQIPYDSFYEKIDALSLKELWEHHYAHGYALGINFIPIHLPYYDKEFYDQYLESGRAIRWSKKFQQAVILSDAPELQNIPISFGHCKTPYGDSLIRYAPLLYHRLITRMSSFLGVKWSKYLDNFKPYLQTRQWYVKELESHIQDMLHNGVLQSIGLLKIGGIIRSLYRQKISLFDFSNQINVLITLAHLLEYVENLKVVRSPL